jgi:hypothetical protein
MNEFFQTDIEPERYELFAEPKYHFALDRRDFLRIAGGGIVICLLVADAQAQQRGQRRGRGGFGGGPQEISAGCTSTNRERPPFTPAKPKSARTSARRCRRSWRKSCVCRWSRSS